MGPGGTNHPGALTLLQSAVNACGGRCAVDGLLGPKSIGQINSLDPAQLLEQYKELVAQRYWEIAAGNDKLAGDLSGWLDRLHA
jgi:hypothetical protein